MYPTKIRQIDKSTISVRWSDNHDSSVTLRLLRDSCPCAGCKGETVLFQTYVPPPVDATTPGRYTLRSISPVGNYALKLAWGDGHDMGMYTWDLLRSLCECDICIDENRRIREGV